MLVVIVGALVWLFAWVFSTGNDDATGHPPPLTGTAADAAGRADANAWLTHAANCDPVRHNGFAGYVPDSGLGAFISLEAGQEISEDYMAAFHAECTRRLPRVLTEQARDR